MTINRYLLQIIVKQISVFETETSGLYREVIT